MVKRFRILTTMIPLLILTIALAAWAIHEGRRQRQETAEVLAAQATLLARTLGPGLEAASTAAREIEESAASRVLENTRILSVLWQSGGLTATTAESLAEQNDIDTIIRLDRSGAPKLIAGTPVSETLLRQMDEVIAGEADEMVLGPQLEDGVEHIAAVVRTTDGGAIFARVHAPSSLAYSGAIGTANLLHRLAGSGGVLYLGYSVSPGGKPLEASWDGEPIPPVSSDGDGRRTVRGREVFEVVVPVSAPAGFQASLRVGLDGQPLAAASVSAVRRTAMVGIVLSVFSLALVFIALLSRSRVLEREEAGRQLAEVETARRRSERLAAAGALTAGLAHEVRSPLNAIGLAAQRMERNHSPEDEVGRFAAKVRGEIGRLEAILREFLELASPVGQARKVTDIRMIAGEVVDLLGDEAVAEGISLVQAGSSCRAPVDPESIRRSLINLVRNAIQASPAGGKVLVETAASDGHAQVTISDNGPGVDEATADQLFDAFVTNQAGGVGLGLALVRRVAEEHGGTATLSNNYTGGALAELRLPAAGGGEMA
jgi:signal transduction histidine kinase